MSILLRERLDMYSQIHSELFHAACFGCLVGGFNSQHVANFHSVCIAQIAWVMCCPKLAFSQIGFSKTVFSNIVFPKPLFFLNRFFQNIFFPNSGFPKRKSSSASSEEYPIPASSGQQAAKTAIYLRSQQLARGRLHDK